jgi:hemerythrin
MGITWKKEFRIGVQEIDAQHQELFTRLDRFIEAIEQGEGGRQLAPLLQFLDDYTRRHFMAEENLQRRFNYPHVEMHVAEHRNFLKKLERLAERLAQGEAADGLVRLTSDVLQQWLIQHICQVDKVLGAFIIEQRNAEWEQYLRDHF